MANCSGEIILGERKTGLKTLIMPISGERTRGSNALGERTSAIIASGLSTNGERARGERTFNEILLYDEKNGKKMHLCAECARRKDSSEEGIG
jgi:hypothetical protein